MQSLTFGIAALQNMMHNQSGNSPSAITVVFSDASDTGYGGYVVEHGPYTAVGQWSDTEARQSSTW